jgi:hypothetical protein
MLSWYGKSKWSLKFLVAALLTTAKIVSAIVKAVSGKWKVDLASVSIIIIIIHRI